MSIGKALVALILIFTSHAYSEKLDLSKHKMSVGGHAQLTYDASNIAKIGIAEADVNLSYGYFVLNNLLVGLNLEIGSNLYLFPKFRGTFGPSLLYAFGTKSIASPYLEFEVDVTLRQTTTWRLGIGLKPTVGVLLALNKSVALDLGISSKIDIPIKGEPNYTSIRGALGHLGIRAFF